MSTGLDAMTNVSSIISTIKNDGYSFVCRYYNTNIPSKNLTLSEAQAISRVGLYNISIWENGYPTSASYFSYSKGVSDGTAAINYAHNTIGQPDTAPIYIAVDYDASISDLDGVITAYFNGIVAAMGNLDYYYPLGVYGSGLTCQTIYNNIGQVIYTWLARSPGWQGYSTYTAWNIKQSSGGTMGGIAYDNDQSKGNAGGFQV